MLHTLSVFTKLAWRNLLRNKRRTGIMLLILSLGASSLVLVGGFLDDLMVHMREDFIHTQNGHIQISRPGFREEGFASPLDYLISDAPALASLLYEEKHVTLVAPRLRLLGVASGNGAQMAVQFIGVDPAAEKKMGEYRHAGKSDTSLLMVQGRALADGDGAKVVMGESMQKGLGMKMGDGLNFLTARQEGALDGRNYEITGSFRTFMKAFDERTLFVPLTEAQKLIGTPGSATHLLLLLDKTEATDAVIARLRQVFKDKGLKYEVIPWYEQADYYHQCRSFLNRIFAAVLILMASIFAFTVSNMMNLAIQERTREFGTMLAIGNDRSVIFSTIVAEALLMGLFGAVLGAVLGYGLGAVVTAIGIPMPPPPQGSGPYDAFIHFSGLLFLVTMALTVASALFGSLIPGFRTSRLPILEALAA
ncbi:MAG TPA: ABC transporter permease [bacterium]|nr:ABC transporter permease [bacterium]